MYYHNQCEHESPVTRWLIRRGKMHSNGSQTSLSNEKENLSSIASLADELQHTASEHLPTSLSSESRPGKSIALVADELWYSVPRVFNAYISNERITSSSTVERMIRYFYSA